MLSIIITSFWNYTASIIKEAVLELCALELSSFLGFGWRVANMKLGLRSVAATAAVLAATSQAQCPDYTTYSQVCRSNGRLMNGRGDSEAFLMVEPSCAVLNWTAGFAVYEA